MEICCDPKRVLKGPGYAERYAAHEPPAELVDALRSISEPATVLVVFGVWCQDSRRVVPEVLKAMAAADNGNLQLLAVHVSYAETDPSPFMAGPVAVKRYPTTAFLAGRFQTTEEIPEGVEKARFVEQSPNAGEIASAFC